MDIVKFALEDFKGLVHYLRNRKKLTYDRLAEKVGCSSSYCYRVEKGTRNPNLEMRILFLIGLEVSGDIIIEYIQKVISRQEEAERDYR